MVNILSVLAAFLCVTTLALGVYILKLDPRKRLNQLCFLTILFIAFFNFSGCFVYQAPDKAALLFWYRAGGITILIAPLILHTNLELVGVKKRIKYPLLAAYYGCAVYFYYLDLHLQLTYADFIKKNGVWIFVIPERGADFVFLGTYLMTLYFICFILLGRGFLRAEKKREKKQIGVFFVSLVIIMVFFVFCLVNRPLLGMEDYGVSPLFQSLWPLGVAIAMAKYRFLGITHDRLGADVIDNIPECVLVADGEGFVIYANPGAKSLVPECEKKRIGDFIEDFDSVGEDVRRVLDGSLKEFGAALNVRTAGGGTTLMSMRFSAGKDKFGDILGVVVIARPVAGVREFVKKHKLTAREFTVIRLLLTGASNRGIAGRLRVAESTIKTHVEHVYRKTGVNNKIGLSNLLRSSGVSLSPPAP